MKGKKFTAAEKHFQKKEEHYIKRIKVLEALVAEKQQQEDSLIKQIKELQERNSILTDQNSKLLEICKMSESDLNSLVEKDKDVAEAARCILRLMHTTGMY